MNNNKDILMDVRELYSTRVLIFMEVEPLSNRYAQVLLTKDQFIKVSDTLYNVHEIVPENDGFINVELSDDEIKLPDDITNFKRK